MPFQRICKRPSAKDLLKHRFVKNARKSPRLLERIRERPKLQVMKGKDTQRPDQALFEDASEKQRIPKGIREDEPLLFSHGKSPRNASWDFSTTGTQGTGTVRSAVKPSHLAGSKEKRFGGVSNQAVARVPSNRESEWHGVSSSANVSRGTFYNIGGEESASGVHEEGKEALSLEDGKLSVSSSGTVVTVRSPREGQTASVLIDQGAALSSSRGTSSEDVSSSGTIVMRNKLDESDTIIQTQRSRLGHQEKASNISHEDSATNLAEAKAALQAGLKRGNPRERHAQSKPHMDSHESKSSERSASSDSMRDSRDPWDAPKVSSKPTGKRISEDEDGARSAAAASSPALSLLLIPALKEVDKENHKHKHSYLLVSGANFKWKLV